MNGMKLFGRELQRISKDKKLLIPIIAILFIPLIYAVMFLWSFLDPYAKMDELPVAVVNLDEGAVFEGKSLHIGDDLVENLKESNAFNFHFISEKEAQQGLDDLTYYMIIEIPNNFSENATTLLKEHPNKLQLKYFPNDSYNFLASQIGETAVSKIQATMASEVSKTYAETIFTTISNMGDGLKQASDGSEQLANGTVDIHEGSVELKENLQLLASKSIDFQNGLSTAQSGTSELAIGSKELATGLGQLADAGGKLLNGTEEIHNGTDTLTSGISEAANGINSLDEKIPSLLAGTTKVYDGLKQFQTSLPKELAANISEQLAGGSEEMNTGIDQLNATINEGLNEQLAPQLTEQLSNGAAEQIAENMIESEQAQIEQLDQLLTTYGVAEKDAILADFAKNAPSKQEVENQLYQSLKPSFATGIQAGVDKSINNIDDGFNQYQNSLSEQLTASNIKKQIADAVNPVFDELTGGLSTVQQGQSNVQEGIHQLATGLSQLQSGAIRLSEGEKEWSDNMALFTKKLADAETGAVQLDDGSSQLLYGMNQLIDGASQFSDGTEQLTEGSVKLADGTSELQSGSTELYTKLHDASEQVGDLDVNEETYDMMASPVSLDIHHVNKVDNYGTGFAPYFISLGLFVGALLLTIIFPLKDTAGIPKSGLSWFMSKFSVMATVGIIQAVLTDLLILYGLNIHVQNIPLFFLFSIITSLTFVTLIQLLVTVGNNPGRFVAIIILILQLTSSAGTFPLEVIPKAVQWFNPLLPMTYSVQGFKAIISSGDYGFMWHNVGILFLYIIAAIIITACYFVWQHKKQFSSKSEVTEQVIA
ncbi:YhgE/Pip family protein [Ornithinibacillus sp. 179-J 7C1 HS]|uniref:YhgE/Pip family protein n=1 Tax=Ornithinibacillus sp. 179-J 7C1 HS TaxID=3142384 RepID=UPI0039A0CE4B